LGLITPNAPGITLDPLPPTVAKLIVDKAVILANIYQLVFLDTKLIAKRLTSRWITVGIGVTLAVLGGLAGGLTGFSVEEFLAQRKRDKIDKENSLTTVFAGDIEIPYERMQQVRLTRMNLSTVANGRVYTWSFPGDYAYRISLRLRGIIPAERWAPSGSTKS